MRPPAIATHKAPRKRIFNEGERLYSKLSDDFCIHEKILEVGNEAAGVFARMLSYCGRGTDGKVPDEMVRFIAGGDEGLLEKLVAADLIKKRRAGWLVVNYLKHNISREQWDRQRKQSAERQRRWREKQASRNGKPDAVPELGQSGRDTE